MFGKSKKTICSTCGIREVPAGECNSYLMMNKMCSPCFTVFCDTGLFYGEILSSEDRIKGITAWEKYRTGFTDVKKKGFP